MIGANGVGRAVQVCDSHDRRVLWSYQAAGVACSPTEGEPGSIGLGKGKDAVGVVASVPDQPDMRSERLAEAPPKTSHFGSPLQLSRVHWVQPKLVMQLKYLAWTDQGLMRQVIYHGIREDKLAREIRRPSTAR
jgi:hypothetical protein